MNLIYSGNFVANAEQDSFAVTRLQIGINPSQFRWPLESGEVFHTPEAVLVYGEHGLDDMSNTFHRLYRRHLMRDPWREGDRPIVLNNWEATYFAFDEAKLLELADSASALGVEVLVLDDGWFGNRNDDHRSLGDWQVNLKKLPHGIAGLSQAIHQRGLKFGLWVEPEMVSVDSDLYRQHPDWCLSVPDRSRSEGRHQLILDLSRDDVVEWMIGWLSDLLQTGGIDYIKWDMNRHMTEVGSALLPPEKQTQVGHRYMLGLYRVLETLTHAFPDVLFEGCSGGGGRFDPGMLFYMPQTWTSDDSDAIERLIIQHGTSLVYPPLSMTAHVSAVPNHQVGRKTPMMTRGLVAMAANFGYELDFTALNADDRQAISAQIRLYKALRPLVQTGRLHRLLDPHQGNAAAWMFVSQDRAQAFVVWVERLAEVNGPVRWLRLRGLDAERAYHVAKLGEDGVFQDVGIAGGDLLMAVGLSMLYVADFGAVAWQLTRMES
jgi:alpha-galactosidase